MAENYCYRHATNIDDTGTCEHCQTPDAHAEYVFKKNMAQILRTIIKTEKDKPKNDD